MKHKIRVGILTQVYGEGGFDYFFEYAPSKYYTVKFKEGAEIPPLNKQIKLCMSVENIDYYRMVCDHKLFYTEME